MLLLYTKSFQENEKTFFCFKLKMQLNSYRIPILIGKTTANYNLLHWSFYKHPYKIKVPDKIRNLYFVIEKK